MALPTLQGALMDGSGEAAMVCDMPEPCKFPSLDNSCHKRFLWTRKEVDLAQHPVVGLVRVGDAQRFPKALGFESLDPFFRDSNNNKKKCPPKKKKKNIPGQKIVSSCY